MKLLPHSSLLRLCLLLCAGGWSALLPAQEPTAAATPAPAAPLPPVVARYEQMLAASPAKGAAFDKVYQHFFAGEGLDALAARWQARAAATDSNAPAFLLLQGLLAERRAHPADARALYTQYTAAHPADPRGWTALGELETAEGRFGPSAAALARALTPEAAPPVPPAARPALYRALARAQARDFLVAASLATWRRLAAEFPDDPSVLQEVGEAFQEGEAYDEALATFAKVRALARRDNDAFGRVNATLRMGQVEEARGHAKEAVAVYEGVVAEAKAGSWLEREARARIETLYRGQEDLPGLADYYKQWLADHPKDVEVATRRAAALLELNRKDEAIALLKEAVAWAPGKQELQVELARRLGEAGRPAEGAAVMEKLTAVAPEEKSYWQLLGDARWQLLESLPANTPDPEKGKLKADALAAWGHLSPAEGKPDPAATGQLADLLAAHRLTAEALAQYARAAAQAPDLPDARERWAAYLAQIGRRDEARQVAAGLATATPRSATAANYGRLAGALDRLDDPEGALDATARGLTLEPRSFDLLTQRWQQLAARKRWDEATALYPALLAAAPNGYFADQVQTRHIAALQAAGKLADTRRALAARLGEGKPPLDENEMGLLVRADLQSGTASSDVAGQPDDPLAEARRALDEGRARFPRAAALVKLQGELARRARDPVGQVAVLRQLTALQPAGRADALAEIARVWRDADRPDDALAAARELVAASPANAAAHLLLADLLLQAGRADEGVARLRDAVRLSDRPNDVRLRLARIEGDLGRTADARQTLDEAFEAAADARERLGLMKALTEAYQRDRRLDELIARFQRLQQGEAEGWRYALYLAEIYQETQDFGAARRELAKALAARPRDAALLRQLARLAGEEQNGAELVRYQTLLAEAEPSDANRFSLVLALLENGEADAALAALRANLSAILKTPGAWDELLPLLARNDLTAKAGDLLAAELGGAGADAKSRFTVALFQAVAGDLEKARATFWAVFDAPAPRPASNPAAPAPPALPKVGSGPIVNRLFTSVYSGDSVLEQRFRAGQATRGTAAGLLTPAGLGGGGGGYYGRRGFRGGGGGNAPGVSLAGGSLPGGPDPADTARDAALVYLAALAVKDGSAPQFLAELDRHLAARGGSRADRLLAYALIEATDPLLGEVARQVQAPEEGLDPFCFARVVMEAYGYGNRNAQSEGESAPPPARADALAAVFDPLLARVLAADPSLDARQADSLRYFFFQSLGRKEQAEAVRQQAVAAVDGRAPFEQMVSALPLLLAGDFAPSERAKLREICAALPDAAARAGASPAAGDYEFVPLSLFGEEGAAGSLSAADFAEVLAGLVPLWYPAASPSPGAAPAAAGRANPSLRAPNVAAREENYLPAGRWFTDEAWRGVESLAETLRRGDPARTAAFQAQLARQAAELPPARRIYPQLLGAYVAAIGGENDAALAAVQRLLADAPADADLRLLAAVLLNRAGRFADALGVLKDLDPVQCAESAPNAAQVFLTAAVGAKDREAGRAAAARLAALRLDPDERQAVAEDLKTLDLTEEAEKLTAASANPQAPARRPTGPGSAHTLFDYETAQQIELAVDRKDDVAALALARNVLAALPPPSTVANGNDQSEYVLQAVRRALKEFKRRGDFLADAERQLARDPDSLTLNYQLALLHEDDPGVQRVPGRNPGADRPGPDGPGLAAGYWRKLAALRPKEVRYTRALAHWLAGHGGRAEAAGLYDRLIETDPDATLANFEDLRPVYAGERMAALGERMLAAPTRAGAALAARNANGYAYFQVAQECAKLRRADLVAALCRRALAQDQTANPGGYANPDVYKLLLQTLVDAGRRDEALDALVSLYAPAEDEGKDAAAAPPSELGFRNPAYRPAQARPWLASLSWSLEGVDLYGLAPLETARAAGLLPGLRAALSARRDANPPAFAGRGLDWLLTLLRVEGRDPAVLAELPALLNIPPAAGKAGKTGGAANAQQEAAVRLALARRLGEWPGHEDLALEAFRGARRALAADPAFRAYSPGSLAAIASLQEAGAALRLDDPRSALATLREFAAQLRQGPGPRNGGNAGEVKRLLGLLLRCGPEADGLYTEFFARAEHDDHGKPANQRDFYFGYELERSERAGDAPRWQALGWLLGGDPDAAQATLVYELRAEHPTDKGGAGEPGRFPTSRGRSFLGSEGERTLTFHYGPDAAHLAPVGQLKTTRTFGTWTGPVPPGSGVLQVTVDTPRPQDAARAAATPDPTAPPTDEAGEPSPAGDGTPSDYWLRAVRTPNLLTNPGFDGLGNRPDSLAFALDGWRDLPAGFWRPGHGENPLPGQPYVQAAADDRQAHTIYGARIPLEKGRAYFQSGWVRDGYEGSSIALGRRYLNAEGRVLKTSECPTFSTLTWRWHSQRLLPGKAEGRESDAIPASAAYVEPFIRFEGAEDWTGLFLGRME